VEAGLAATLPFCGRIRQRRLSPCPLNSLSCSSCTIAATVIGSSEIQSILIEDAPGQVMPKSNADAFPAHGNHYGKTAGVKIDLAFDLLTSSIVSHGLYAATEQDKTIGKEFVIEVRRGDLVLRDMGYFSLSEFTAIEQLEPWWLTRLPLTTGVMLADGRSLEKYLKSIQENIIDIDAVVGEQCKKCRLFAMRAAPEVSAARRAERRKKARDCGKKPCPKGLIRDGWHLMLTNPGKDVRDDAEQRRAFRRMEEARQTLRILTEREAVSKPR